MTVPQESPEFWSQQARALALDIEAVSQALHLLAVALPRAVQQAADLGLMREQHDVAGLRQVQRGETELAIGRERRQDEDRAALIALRGEVALLRAVVERLLGDIPATTTRPEGA